jgi:hypothetical protein
MLMLTVRSSQEILYSSHASVYIIDPNCKKVAVGSGYGPLCKHALPERPPKPSTQELSLRDAVTPMAGKVYNSYSGWGGGVAKVTTEEKCQEWSKQDGSTERRYVRAKALSRTV